MYVSLTPPVLPHLSPPPGQAEELEIPPGAIPLALQKPPVKNSSHLPCLVLGDMILIPEASCTTPKRKEPTERGQNTSEQTGWLSPRVSSRPPAFAFSYCSTAVHSSWHPHFSQGNWPLVQECLHWLLQQGGRSGISPHMCMMCVFAHMCRCTYQYVQEYRWETDFRYLSLVLQFSFWTGFFLWPGACKLWDWIGWPPSHWDLTVSDPSMGLQVYATGPGFYVDTGDPNSGSHAYSGLASHHPMPYY